MTRAALKRIDKAVCAVSLHDAAQEAGVDPADVQELILRGLLFTGALSRDEFFISDAAIPQLRQLIKKHVRPSYDIDYKHRAVLNKRPSIHGGAA